MLLHMVVLVADEQVEDGTAELLLDVDGAEAEQAEGIDGLLVGAGGHQGPARVAEGELVSAMVAEKALGPAAAVVFDQIAIEDRRRQVALSARDRRAAGVSRLSASASRSGLSEAAAVAISGHVRDQGPGRGR